MNTMYKDQSTRELLSQVAEMVHEIESRKVANDRDVWRHLEPFSRNEKEQFFVITLNGQHVVIDIHVITTGLVNRSLVHPREVFRPAIMDNAVSVIIAHNHPSGNLEGSIDDMNTIRQIYEAGRLLKIDVLDHIWFGPTGYCSALSTGQMPS